MTVEQMTKRINELYHKSQAEGLTEEEKEEQKQLRQAYVANVRANLRGQLNNISIVEKDGSITNLGENAKKMIRQRILKTRDAISPADRARYDLLIRENILNTLKYREADVILAYASYRSEVDTIGLIGQALADGKYVFAPKVSGDEMEFWQITTTEDLLEGYKGIPEPLESISFPEWLTEKGGYHIMMWMPGVAFDRERHRIGYGKGFYDRYLSRLMNLMEKISDVSGVELSMTTAALAYSCQVLEQIPCDPHDMRPDIVITEKRVLLQENLQKS